MYTLPSSMQPKLEEVGPLGYVKRTTKYNVRFSANDSNTVTYRSWTTFDEVWGWSSCHAAIYATDRIRPTFRLGRFTPYSAWWH